MFTGVDRGWPLRRPDAVITASVPLGMPRPTRIFRTALVAFMPPLNEYVLATLLLSLDPGVRRSVPGADSKLRHAGGLAAGLGKCWSTQLRNAGAGSAPVTRATPVP